MRSRYLSRSRLSSAILVFGLLFGPGTMFAQRVLADDPAAEADKLNSESEPQTKVERSPSPPKQLFRGKVVMVGEALKRRDIVAFDELDGQVALEAPGGELLPIIPDWRGRAFFQDKRLRNRRVEVVGSVRPGIPYLQVIMIFVFDEAGTRQYMDYWCDICSIPMYEIKPCDCCQADTILRLQPRDLPNYLHVDKQTLDKEQASDKQPAVDSPKGASPDITKPAKKDD